MEDKYLMYGLLEYEKLVFLENYGFSIVNNSSAKIIEINCIRDDYCITYHEWHQFGDFNIFVTKSLDDLKKYNYLRTYGIRWLIDNILPRYKLSNSHKNPSYAELVEFYIREQLKNRQEVFGIQIN